MGIRQRRTDEEVPADESQADHASLFFRASWECVEVETR